MDKKPKRIGIDARMYTPKFTGIGRYVYELIKNLAAIDQENEYFIFLNPEEFEKFSVPNANFHKVSVDAKHYSFAEQTSFLKSLYAQKLHLMHFTHFNAPLLYLGKSVVTIHDLILHFFPGNKLNKPHQRAAYKLVLNSALKKAERVIAVSNSTKNDLVKISKTNPEKIRVIYEAANEDFHLLENQNSKYKTLLKYNISKPFILYTGVWRVHKNLPNLIKAFHILKQDYRLNYNLVITGKRDDTYPEVVDEIASLGLEKDVILTGMVEEDELVSFYNCAECYAFPSLYEGFGLPVLEAMACALPVVCSDSSSLPEVCGEGNAVFFNPRSPKDMAEKIAEVCLNKELQDELKARGLERVKDFSWRRMAEETLKVYQEIF